MLYFMVILLYCFILYYILLYFILLYYIILYYTILYYIILYYIISYHIILYYIVLYCIILYYILLYYIILYLFPCSWLLSPWKPASLGSRSLPAFRTCLCQRKLRSQLRRFPGRHGGSPIAGWFISTGTSQRKMENWGYAHDLGIIHL